MRLTPDSLWLERLRGWITLDEAPFTDWGSQLLVSRKGSHLTVRLAGPGPALKKQEHTFSGSLSLVDDIGLRVENGTLVDCELVSDPRALVFVTWIGVFTLAFSDEDGCPRGRSRLRFRTYDRLLCVFGNSSCSEAK